MRGKIIGIIIGAAWMLPGLEARGDGGALRFSDRRDDCWIAVFTSPTPLRVGPVDVSVLVQNTDPTAPAADSSVVVRAYPFLQRQHETSAPATMEAATNKLLRAAQLTFLDSGWWHIEVEIQGSTTRSSRGFNVEVAEPLPDWLDLCPWICWPLLPIGLFAIHQWLSLRVRFRLNTAGRWADFQSSRP